MRINKLSNYSVEQLVDFFLMISREQRDLNVFGPPSKYNRLYDRILAIVEELKSRPGDQRNALRPFLDHLNLQVKMNAAYALLPIAKDEAVAVLRWVAESRHMPFCVDASMSVEAIEEDDFPRGSNPNSIHRHAYLANLKKE